MSENCYLCGGNDLIKAWEFNAKPNQETDLGIPSDKYHREIFLCNQCGIYNNFHEYDFGKLYSGKYNKCTYQNNLLARFYEVMNLPADKSDNKNRVKRIVSFYEKIRGSIKNKKVLDVGSGLCVFLAEIQKYGIEGHCIDPDKLSTEHALINVRVKSAFCGYIENYTTSKQFDIITFNKVLEHTQFPIKILKKIKSLLKPDGILYIELPDSEQSLNIGSYINRNEFGLEHYTIFNLKSIEYLVKQANFRLLKKESIIDPSGKTTVYAFATLVDEL